MIKYYTNRDMRKILNCSQSTLDRQIKTMNLKVVRFGVNGLPRYNAYDVLGIIEFGYPFKELSKQYQDEIKDMLSDA
jgi:hypothetical protein|tara:strand:+ start:634 stop:864 length:231 start_codon:yes stop_codon:yes gene_type:complete